MASIYDKNILSASDLARVNSIIDAWQKTDDENTKKQLHDSAEAIRNSYGYSGGASGDQFILTDIGVYGTSTANDGYVRALESAAAAEQSAYKTQIADAAADGEERLRQAYIKNMQDSLGIAQSLRASGITGGATESMEAYMNNVYNTSRNDIMSDTAKTKATLASDAAAAKTAADTAIAKAKLEGAADRADRLTAAEQTAYERQQDALDREYTKATDDREYDYRKYVDDREYEYRKTVDDRDFEYQKQNDALDRAAAAAKSSSSSGSSKKTQGPTVSNVLAMLKAGVYDKSFAAILGVSDDEVKRMAESYSLEDKKKAAWDLLEQGIYDESFPELLGYSETTLQNYANSYLQGY